MIWNKQYENEELHIDDDDAEQEICTEKEMKCCLLKIKYYFM